MGENIKQGKIELIYTADKCRHRAYGDHEINITLLPHNFDDSAVYVFIK